MRLSRFLFLRALALAYLSAFLSLLVQVRGLYGERGILPVRAHLEAAAEYIGPSIPARLATLPSLLWAAPGDRGLQVLCAAGAALSLLLLVDLAPAPVLALLWLGYLSLVAAGPVFLSFQWDVLLLETGFLAIFLAPLRVVPRRPSRDEEPSRIVVWLFRWLVFRLMLGSGVVKLASGDPTWRDLSALDYHFETQPLPTLVGWWAHQLAPSLHATLTAGMFVIELVLPWLIFTTRRLRALAALAFVSLQALIGLCGNYTFFNFLSAALCLLLVEDTLWPERFRPAARAGDSARLRAWLGRYLVPVPLAALLALLSILPVLSLLRVRVAPPAPLVALTRAAAPFHLVNRYGLFAVMTTTRPEIRIEGSSDGVEWREYRFRWKPDDPRQAPRWCQPHQPRLDWQMWFAALASYPENLWVLNLMQRLRQGEPAVLDLLASNPFPDSPPRLVRASLWEYRMTDRAGRRASGAWWQRRPLGPWAPSVGP